MTNKNTNTNHSIDTLIPDIYSLLQKGHAVAESDVEKFAKELAKLLQERLKERKKVGELRMSNFGSPDRKLWYSVNKPELAEDLDGATYLKFLIGDVYEAILLFLAEQSGHTVELKQEELDIDGMKGHPDAIIDGVLVDVKTASGWGINKFKNHALETDDPFFYLGQLSNYLEALSDREELKVKKEGVFLAADKVNGELVLDKYKKQDTDIKGELARKREMLSGDIPPRCYSDVPDGSSGNRKLGVECSYCSYRKSCWPGLRSFAYSNGSRYLTKVVRVPDVEEIT